MASSIDCIRIASTATSVPPSSTPPPIAAQKYRVSDDFLAAVESVGKEMEADYAYAQRLQSHATSTLLVLAVLCAVASRLVSRRDMILVLFTAALIGMVLFPPFTTQFRNGYSISAGYGFLFEPPKTRIDSIEYHTIVNTPLLVTQLLAMSAVGGVIYFLASRPRST